MIDKGYLLGERYRILDTLGEGGTANVYLAEDIILQRQVAVKMLRLDLQKDHQTLARFEREALATSELSHPNIVSVLDVSVTNGQPYMVMEYIDGPDLKTYIQKHSPLPLPEVIQIMDQVLSAITLAHQHNVIHRDLKPQNILMDKRGNIKIADFGIAVALNQSSVTQTNSVMGSVHYMSPEQTRGCLATKQSDIYSLGIILYELITGSVPFAGETALAVALKHAQEPIPMIRRNHPNVPQALENVVLRATSKDSRDRYESALAMRADLDSSLDASRADEAKFQPSYHPDEDKTIILPGFTAADLTQTSATALTDEPETSQPAVPFWKKIGRHKWWWLFTGLIGMVIVAIIFAALTQRSAPLRRVPDVTNLTPRSANQRLKKVGFVLGQVHSRHSAKIRTGRVIETLPATGAAVAKGKSVDLVISTGIGLATVPDVSLLDYEVARAQLKRRGFEVERVNDFSNSVPKDNVISQSVAGGVRVNPGSTTITLTVSLGKFKRPTPTTVTLADLTGDTLAAARRYASAHQLQLNLHRAYSDDVAKDRVLDMGPNAGTKVKRNSQLTLTLSRGPKPTTTTVKKTFTVQYSGPDQSQGNNDQGNHIQIFIKDSKHDLTNVYQDSYIKKDTNFTVSLLLQQEDGEIKVLRDGKTVLEERVAK